MDERVAEFSLYLAAEKGASPLTIDAYKKDIENFRDFLKQMSVIQWIDVTQENLISYLSYRSTKGYQPSTLSRSLIAIKVFYRFLKREGIVPENITRLLDGPKLWQLIPEVLSTQEVERLLTVPNKQVPFGSRDLAILEMLYATGCRVTELCTLNIYDVDDTSVKIFGKGGQERMVPIGRQALVALDHYLIHFRKEATGDRKEPLFLSKGHKRLDRVQVWRLIKKYAKLAGITKTISPHTLRHSYATHLLDNGADVRVIQELLGHASISSTDRYTHISKAHLKSMFYKFHHPTNSESSSSI